MNDELFYELIRVTIGTQDSLSHTPSNKEWKALYDMAKKQSLIGVCFAALQRLGADADEGFARIGISEMLYLTWMGMTAQIQKKNETVNQQCAELQAKLSADGKPVRFLKGQGVGQQYAEHLLGLRQSGDIDIWMVPFDKVSENAHFKSVMEYVKDLAECKDFNRQHVQLPVFEDTEVEVHFMPSRMNCPWHNKRLQKFFREKDSEYKLLKLGALGREIRVPSVGFNIVYMLQHCFNHFLFEGIGLRQIMDYYFVLRTSYENGNENENQLKTLSSLGLKRFASAMMWVMKEVFGLEEQYMVCEPNEKEGRFLLSEIMTGGNFGKYGKDGVMEGHAKGKVTFFVARMKRNWRFLLQYPSEIIWSPYAMLSHYYWKRSMNNKR